MQEFLTIFTVPIEGETSTIKNESYEKVTIKKHKNSLSKILCYISTGFFYLRQWHTTDTVLISVGRP